MTRITLTPAQLARAERNGSQPVEVLHDRPARQKSSNSREKPGEARKRSRATGEPSQAVTGLLNGKQHRWRFKRTINGVAARLWQSECYTFSQHSEPQPGRGDEEKCGRGCFDEEGAK